MVTRCFYLWIVLSVLVFLTARFQQVTEGQQIRETFQPEEDAIVTSLTTKEDVLRMLGRWLQQHGFTTILPDYCLKSEGTEGLQIGDFQPKIDGIVGSLTTKEDLLRMLCLWLQQQGLITTSPYYYLNSKGTEILQIRDSLQPKIGGIVGSLTPKEDLLQVLCLWLQQQGLRTTLPDFCLNVNKVLE